MILHSSYGEQTRQLRFAMSAFASKATFIPAVGMSAMGSRTAPPRMSRRGRNTPDNGREGGRPARQKRANRVVSHRRKTASLFAPDPPRRT